MVQTGHFSPYLIVQDPRFLNFFIPFSVQSTYRQYMVYLEKNLSRVLRLIELVIIIGQYKLF